MLELEVDRSPQEVAAEVRRGAYREVGIPRVDQVERTRAEVVVQVFAAEAPPRQEGPVEADTGGPAGHPLRRRARRTEPGGPARSGDRDGRRRAELGATVGDTGGAVQQNGVERIADAPAQRSEHV